MSHSNPLLLSVGTSVACMLLGAAGVGVLLYVVARARRRRSGDMYGDLAGWAAQRGWRLDVRPRTDLPRMFGDVVPFHTREALHRRDCTANWLLHGRVGTRPALAFQLVGQRRGARHGGTTWYKVITVRLDRPVPPLAVEPRGWSRGSGEETPLAQRFSAAYEVQVGDPELARRVLTPELQAWFVGRIGADRPGIRFVGDNLICWEHGTLTAGWVDWILPVVAGIVDTV